MRNRLLIAVPALSLLLLGGFWNPTTIPTVYDSTRWIDSGLDHERQGDLAEAEHDLLEAARVDLLYQPRWTLAGFYYRRSNSDQFWSWAQQALAVGSRDLGALFALCWKFPDPEQNLWSRAMPDSKTVWEEYLYFLTTTGRMPEATFTAIKIAGVADLNDKPTLINYCDLALSHQDSAGAKAVWTTMCRRGILPFPPDALIPNGDFQMAPSGRGFDWRVPNPSLASGFQAGQVTFTLNGFQQENEDLLTQPLALEPLKPYRLEFEYRASGFDGESGVGWIAGAAASELLNAPEWSAGQFDLPPDASTLALNYHRPRGSTLARGAISLRKVSLVSR